jgi:membrane protein implicated in regulation of membrane protease activity
LTLVAAPVPEMSVSPWVAISLSVAFGGITWFLVRLAMRARKRKARIGAEAMVGAKATAMEALAPQGHVLVEGEIWQAEASAPVAAGTALRVVGHEHLLLRKNSESASQRASKPAELTELELSCPSRAWTGHSGDTTRMSEVVGRPSCVCTVLE